MASSCWQSRSVAALLIAAAAMVASPATPADEAAQEGHSTAAPGLAEQGAAALDVRQRVISDAVRVLNEGPPVHAESELGAAVRLLGELRADTPEPIWALLNYLTYRFTPPAEWNQWAWVPLEVRMQETSASSSLLLIGPRAATYAVSRLAHTDDTGMRYACMQLLMVMLGKHAIPVLESAIQQTPDPQAQARLRDILTRHRDYFVGGGCFMLPPPYRGPIPQWAPTTP